MCLAFENPWRSRYAAIHWFPTVPCSPIWRGKQTDIPPHVCLHVSFCLRFANASVLQVEPSLSMSSGPCHKGQIAEVRHGLSFLFMVCCGRHLTNVLLRCVKAEVRLWGRGREKKGTLKIQRRHRTSTPTFRKVPAVPRSLLMPWRGFWFCLLCILYVELQSHTQFYSFFLIPHKHFFYVVT